MAAAAVANSVFIVLIGIPPFLIFYGGRLPAGDFVVAGTFRNASTRPHSTLATGAK
jgi:hypothetical protein